MLLTLIVQGDNRGCGCIPIEEPIYSENHPKAFVAFHEQMLSMLSAHEPGIDNAIVVESGGISCKPTKIATDTNLQQEKPLRARHPHL